VLVGGVCVMQVLHKFVSLLVIVWLGRKRDMYSLFAREKFTEVKHEAVANAVFLQERALNRVLQTSRSERRKSRPNKKREY